MAWLINNSEQKAVTVRNNRSIKHLDLIGINPKFIKFLYILLARVSKGYCWLKRKPFISREWSGLWGNPFAFIRCKHVKIMFVYGYVVCFVFVCESQQWTRNNQRISFQGFESDDSVLAFENVGGWRLGWVWNQFETEKPRHEMEIRWKER